MKTLAVDTSTQSLSLALFNQEKLVYSLDTMLPNQHGATLIPLIDQALKAMSWQVEDINQIIIGRGPGSYTGLRISAAMAKTWAKVHRIVLREVSSLALMASQVKDSQFSKIGIVPLMDARRLTAYTGLYQWQEKEASFELVPILDDSHQEWGPWVERDLLATCKTKGISQLVLVGQYLEEFAQILEGTTKRMGLENDLRLTVLNSPFVPTCHSLMVQSQLVEDIDTYTPFYTHLALAEREWAENHPKEAGDLNYERLVQFLPETQLDV